MDEVLLFETGGWQMSYTWPNSNGPLLHLARASTCTECPAHDAWLSSLVTRGRCSQVYV
ncbi:hypothetical protein BDP27DRAFT_1320185 [Rhodocollybia butyracea]|uniref:Uncharacterized protein n=1 Tax=Rhodocollybia butyracea TaxID=206335 RepID=A0A9P5UA14_9AGAR|nr:hypothetical protein BDP27DRAFT_1320185 [Rhodocollybia butyracea]